MGLDPPPRPSLEDETNVGYSFSVFDCFETWMQNDGTTSVDNIYTHVYNSHVTEGLTAGT